MTTLEKCLATARELERKGKIVVSNGNGKQPDVVTLRNGIIYVNTTFPLYHPLRGAHSYYDYELKSPMSWDTFTHLYMLRKIWEREGHTCED